ncbi:MAG: spore protease YyaC, partial [Bacillota bacterium]
MNRLPLHKVETDTAQTRIHIDDPHAPARVADNLGRHLENLGTGRPVVLLCIGSDRSTGDSLGPLIGSAVENLDQDFFRVYGTLAQPVHATNLQETLEAINRTYADPFIIAVDACLGRLESVGCVNISKGALRPGAGVKKELPPVGDVHITGVVNVGGFMEFTVLQNTRLNMVMRIADVVCAGLKLLAAEQGRPAVSEPGLHETRVVGTQAI